jgi:hypothetical protein
MGLQKFRWFRLTTPTIYFVMPFRRIQKRGGFYAELAVEVIARAGVFENSFVIDYEHQTMLTT